MPGENSLSSVEHIVVLMLENRSFDHMLGFLYSDSGNVSPAGQPYEGLTGQRVEPRVLRAAVHRVQDRAQHPQRLLHAGGGPGEGYMATNDQLFGSEYRPGELFGAAVQ